MPNPHYKYPKDKQASEYRAVTQQICDESGVTWQHRFRQGDLLKILKDSGASSANGACQIFTSMYMNIREMNKDFPHVARRLFKYWSFMNDDKLNDIKGKTISEDEKAEWDKWKKSLRSDPNLSEKEQLQKFISTYFERGGGKQIIDKINAFWDNQAKFRDLEGPYSLSKNSENYERNLERVDVMERSNSETEPFKSLRNKPDSSASFDLDFMHECNNDYYLETNRSYQGNFEKLAEAMAYEIYDCHKENDEIRLLITLKSTTTNNPHSISFTRFSDDLNNIEFCDANRGVFLIPYNDRDKFKQFFKKYLEQGVYQQFEFDGFTAERYGRHPANDPQIQAQLSRINQRTGIEVKSPQQERPLKVESPPPTPHALHKEKKEESISQDNNNKSQMNFSGLMFNQQKMNAGEPDRNQLLTEFVKAVDALIADQKGPDYSLKTVREIPRNFLIESTVSQVQNKFKNKFEMFNKDDYLEQKKIEWNAPSNKV